MEKIGIIGCGAWGLAMANYLANLNNDIICYSNNIKKIEELSKNRTYDKLPGVSFSNDIIFTNDLIATIKDKNIIIFACASIYLRETVRRTRDYIRDNQTVVCLAKGIEKNTLKTMSQIIAEELPNPKINIVVCSGPTYAQEVATNLPTCIIAASENPQSAMYIQEVFSSLTLRVYTHNDVIGVEICGAIKNVIAIACGISDGLGYGENARAALITRGIAEMIRLGNKMGAQKETFMGLAGIGDLVLTCSSRSSRNNRFGYLLGQGLSVKQACQQIDMAVEGLNALPAIVQLSNKYNIEMPIVACVNDVVSGIISPSKALIFLMAREKKAEII